MIEQSIYFSHKGRFRSHLDYTAKIGINPLIILLIFQKQIKKSLFYLISLKKVVQMFANSKISRTFAALLEKSPIGM